MAAGLDYMLSDPNRAQRDKLALLEGPWRAELERLDDAALLDALRAIRKTLNSKKLRGQVDALIGALRRDGEAGGAALPKPVAPVAASAGPRADAEPSPSRAAQPEPELEARLAADPFDRDARLVYRDWLESRGLVEDGRVILGRLADCEDMLTELDWQHGFVRAARLAYTSARFNGERPDLSIVDALAWLLDDPGPGRLIERLTIGLVRHDDNDYSEVCRTIGARRRPALTELELGDFSYEECELNWTSLDAARMWPALPRLRKLWLRAGRILVDGVDLPELRELETVTGGLPDSALAAIADARWPKLERLSLQIGSASEDAATDVALVEPILRGDEFPALRELGLCNCEFTDELCERLAGAPILRQLRSLDLSMGTMGIAGARALIRRPQAFAHLERIDVDDNYLDAEAIELLGQLGPALHVGTQRADEGRGRYASAIE